MWWTATALAAPPVGRWYLEDEVRLPLPMWLADASDAARIAGWKLELVVECGAGGVCAVADSSLSATPYGDDGKVLARVLPSANAALAASTLSLRFDHAGRLSSVNVEGLDTHDRRAAATAENLTLIVARAAAGFDLAIPRGPAEEWPQYRSSILALPDARGGTGGVAVVHRREDGERVESSGQGTVILPLAPTFQTGDAVPQERALGFSIAMQADAQLSGPALVERTWTARGAATALTATGPDYVQRGKVVRLDGPAPPLDPPSLLGPPAPATLPPPAFLGEDPDR